MLTESQLLKAISSGDEAAFTQLYDTRWLKLYGFALSIVENEEDAEDVCADTFAKIWEKRERFEKIEGIDNYLMVMVRNKCLDVRSSKRKKVKKLEVLEPPIVQEGHDKRVEVLSLYTEVVLNKMALLPSGCQRIIRLYYIEGWSHDEIAQSLKLSKNTIRNHRYNGLRILKQMSNLPGVTAVAGTVLFVTLHFSLFLRFF